MRHSLPLIAAVIFAGSLSAQTDPTICKTVSGISTETIVPASQAPSDLYGRLLGLFSGDFAGIARVSSTSLWTSPPGFSNPPSGSSILIQLSQVFLTGPGDTLTTVGSVIFNPGAATEPTQTNYVNSICPLAPCVVEAPQVLTVTGGTGRWAGATGQITSLGIGNLSFPPGIGIGYVDVPVGKGAFVYMVHGQVCVPAS